MATEYKFTISAKDKTKATFRNIRRNILGLKSAIGALALGALVREVAQATATQERAIAQLEQAIRSTSGAARLSSQEIQKYAADLQKVTTFGDEALIEASSQLLTFTRITGDRFKATLELAADLSTRFGVDLKSSVIQLGKALNDPVANLSALSRAGIQFSVSQKEMIKGLVESGRLIEAQQIILGELEVQFGGSARAARDTFGGALQGLSNAFGDLLESRGGLKDAKATIEELTATLSDPQIVSGINAITAGLLSLLNVTVKLAAVTGDKLGDIGRFYGEGIAELVNGSVDPVERLKQKIDEVREAQEDLKRVMRLAHGTFDPTTLTPEQKKRWDALVQQERDLMNAVGQFATQTSKAKAESVKPLADAARELQAVDFSDDFIDLAPLKASVAKEAEAIRKSLMSPREELELWLEKIKELHKLGFLDEEDFAKAIDQYNKKLQDLVEGTADATDEMSVFAEQAARNMQDAFADFLFDPFQGGLKGMLKSFGDTIRRMVAQAAAASVFESLNLGSLFRGAIGGSVKGTAGTSKTIPAVSSVSSSKVQVVQNIDARGADPSSAARLAEVAQQIQESTIAAIADMRARGRI